MVSKPTSQPLFKVQRPFNTTYYQRTTAKIPHMDEITTSALEYPSSVLSKGKRYQFDGILKLEDSISW